MLDIIFLFSFKIDLSSNRRYRDYFNSNRIVKYCLYSLYIMIIIKINNYLIFSFAVFFYVS